MPDDLEILWTEHVVYIIAASERGADWLHAMLPARSRWDMRTISYDDMMEYAHMTKRLGLTIGGMKMPIQEFEI